ncbi:DinB family protein [Mucilaginibacter sp.]|jgi:uncharacterized damage-inducible protein DinB|uniref:DinB family protein n=1 Tax=Mucilaginibacter sp. TaxID=1882438 RepID=UPI00356A8974
MENQLKAAKAQTSLVINQVINYWESSNKTITEFYNKHADEVYAKEVAPGRNRATYLLAHIIAINDSMMLLFGLGNKLFPELTPLADQPEKAVDFTLDIQKLRGQWDTLNKTLGGYFHEMSTDLWLDRHNSVTPEDFAKDATRNKLNVLINRTGHQNHHRGQLMFLNERIIAA